MSVSIKLDIPVRWGDLDAFGHVNNTVFMRYLEEARIVWLEGFAPVSAREKNGPVIVNINCNFRREIAYPATVRVLLIAHCASEKRLVMEHTIVDASDPDILYADAEITALWVDMATGRSIPLPVEVREAVGT